MVVLILGVFAMILFRKPLSQLIGRTERISRDGLLAGPRSQAAAEEDRGTSAEGFMRSFDNRLLVDQEEAIRRDLEANGLTDPDHLEKVLIRSLAATQIQSHFERAYSAIWDSQITLLRQLNAIAAGLSVEDAEAFYGEVVADHPALEEYEFPKYLAFLESHNLARVEDDRLYLTLMGREFLKWMVESGRPDRYLF